MTTLNIQVGDTDVTWHINFNGQKTTVPHNGTVKDAKRVIAEIEKANYADVVHAGFKA